MRVAFIHTEEMQRQRVSRRSRSFMWIGPGLRFAAVGPEADSAVVILSSIVLIVRKAPKGRRFDWWLRQI